MNSFKVVKLSRKEELDQLVAKLTLRIGKKVQQQDVLDACVQYCLRNIDKLEKYFLPESQISEERIAEILSQRTAFDQKKYQKLIKTLYANIVPKGGGNNGDSA